MARQSEDHETTELRQDVGQSDGETGYPNHGRRQTMLYPPNNSVPASTGLNATHTLSREVRHRAAELITDERVLALFHEPLIDRMTKPQGVPVELWDMMTDEHKELVTYKVVSEALYRGLRRQEGR